MKKFKIINDPVSGFVRITGNILPKIISNAHFQRLRRIKQLGFTNLVYPGANHTRFEHALGAFQLMGLALQYLKEKGVNISEEENEAVLAGILLHDIGHGPFSHALEQSIVENISHEELSLVFMEQINKQLKGQLQLAIDIFRDHYDRCFFHELINSQLDIDRLDYLRRDAFYTGVAEGNIGPERIISMMNVHNNHLVIDNKGIYSIENFLLSRRLMYLQVYLHKTVISAEQLLLKILKRARKVAKENKNLWCSPALAFFLYNDLSLDDFSKSNILNNFAALDDFDIFSAIKVWTGHDDKVLADLSRLLVYRNLFKIEIADIPFKPEKVKELMEAICKKHSISAENASYYVFSDSVSNYFYDHSGSQINVLLNDGRVVDIFNTLSGFSLSVSNDPLERFFLCYPKTIL